MITNEQLEQHLLSLEGIDHVEVGGDGYHYQLILVSDQFLGMNKVKRQQWVYTQLQDWITSGRLHALSMETYTKGEWETSHG